MLVSFLSATQREHYGRYPDTLSADEPARYFHLDSARGQVLLFTSVQVIVGA